MFTSMNQLLMFLRKLSAALKNFLISINLRLTSKIKKKWNLIFRFSFQLWLHQGSSMSKIISQELTKSWLVDLEHTWNVRMVVSWEEHALLGMTRKAWTQPRANWYSSRISLGEISSVVTLKLWKGLQIQWNKILSYRLVWRKPRKVFEFLIDLLIRQLRSFRKYWKELAQDFASYCYWKTGDFQDIINCGANELGNI